MTIRVLLAEDNALLRQGLERLLAHQDGIELVGTAGNLPELLEAARSQRPDVVVSDIRMPPTHTDEGIAAAAQLAQDQPGIGVVLLSQHVEAEYAVRFLEQGSARRAYLLKEQLREVFRTKGMEATYLLDAWLAWASRSKLKPFVKVARSIRANLVGIYAALVHGLSNGRVEAMNTRIRLLTKLAYGFHSHRPLIALAMLKLGGLCPSLPRAA